MSAVFREVMDLQALLGHQEEKGQLGITENLVHLVTMVVQALRDYKV